MLRLSISITIFQFFFPAFLAKWPIYECCQFWHTKLINQSVYYGKKVSAQKMVKGNDFSLRTKNKKNCIHALNFAYETIYLLYQRNELEMETKSFKSQKENLLFFLWYVALHLIFGTLIGVRYDKCKYNINAGSLNWKREK